MAKYEVKEFSVETKDGKNPIRIFHELDNWELNLIASFDTLEEARAELARFVPTVKNMGRYFYHECACIEIYEEGDDGEWNSYGDWEEVSFKEVEEDSEKEVKAVISSMLKEKFTDSYFDDIGAHRTSDNEYDINGIYDNYVLALEDYDDADEDDKKKELKKAFDTWTEHYISEEDFKDTAPEEYKEWKDFHKEA